MKSLRTRLLVGLLISSTVVLAVHGLGVYAVVRSRLVGELDRSLIDTLRSNAPDIARQAFALQRGQPFPGGPGGRRPPPGAGRLSPLAASIPGPAERDDLLFQARTRDGKVLLASASLGETALPRLAEELVSATYEDIGGTLARFASLTLPNTDRSGRAVGLVLQLQAPGDPGPRGPPRARPQPARPPALEIVMAIDASEVAETLTQLRWLLILGWLAASTLGAFVIAWLLKLGLAPLSALRQQIDTFDEARPRGRFELPGAPSELLPIVDQLNALVDRMAAALTREQEFTGHAAHELRTPLAGLRATLEVSLSRPRETAAHVASAEQCLEITLQMQQMVEVLLTVARSAAPAQNGPVEQITLGKLLASSWALCADRAAERQITLSLNSADSAPLETDSERLGLLLTNLLGNAVDHGDEGSAIQVALDRQGDQHVLTVSNPASTATTETAQRAFDPFWRGDVARHETARHSGLGLTLCQRLAASLGGRLSASCQGGQFTITLNLRDDRGHRVRF